MIEFARITEEVAATNSTKKKSQILGDYLRGLNDDDLRIAVRFACGRPLAFSDRAVLGIGWSAVSRAINDAGERTPSPVSLRDVASSFEEVRDASGASAKVDALKGLLRRVDERTSESVLQVLGGEMRIGLSEGLVEAAVAHAFSVPLAQVKRMHMITGDLGEAAARCRHGRFDGESVELFRPMRFMLATAVDDAEEAMRRMGSDSCWTEEKYDGIRCQLHRGPGRVELFTRDLRDTTAAFPEVVEAAHELEHEVVIDGEILAYREGTVLRFFELQRRLGRKQVTAAMREQVPVVLVAFDLLRLDGKTLLDEPLRERRRLLEGLGLNAPLLVGRLETADTTADLDRIFDETQARGNEGLMVKDPQSAYTPGRRGMAWLKLKRPLATLDVVVTAVEWGHGKRKGVLSDYTFAVLNEDTGELVNIGKAYTGLTDKEIAAMTQHFLSTTTEDHGYRRSVDPDTILEVAFNSIQKSGRHKSGFALRFPRIVRIRDDKPVAEIDTLRRVRELYEKFYGNVSP